MEVAVASKPSVSLTLLREEEVVVVDGVPTALLDAFYGHHAGQCTLRDVLVFVGGPRRRGDSVGAQPEAEE